LVFRAWPISVKVPIRWFYGLNHETGLKRDGIWLLLWFLFVLISAL
jgi:hypothetical protein